MATKKKTAKKKTIDVKKKWDKFVNYHSQENGDDVEFKMNPKVKTKWVKALKSGKYQQARGELCRTDLDGTKTYCCLGVLCEVMGRKFQKGAGYPGERTLKLAGLDYDRADFLASINDQKNSSFFDIAKFIDKTY